MGNTVMITFNTFKGRYLKMLSYHPQKDCIFSNDSDILRDKIKEETHKLNPDIRIEEILCNDTYTVRDVDQFFRNLPPLNENQRGIVIVRHINRLKQDVANLVSSWVKSSGLPNDSMVIYNIPPISDRWSIILLLDTSYENSEDTISTLPVVYLSGICSFYGIE